MLQLIISTIALIIIAITMFLRAHDLKDKGLRWDIRRVGLVLTGAAPCGVIFIEWAKSDPPNWYDVAFRVGLTLVFMTTPYLPPWHKWLWRGIHGDGR